MLILLVSSSMLLIKEAKYLKDEVNYYNHDVSEVYADYTPMERGFNEPFLPRCVFHCAHTKNQFDQYMRTFYRSHRNNSVLQLWVLLKTAQAD